MIRTLLRLSREAIRYRKLYTFAILSTLALTAVNLAAPKVLSAMTGIVETGVDENSLRMIGNLTVILIVLFRAIIWPIKLRGIWSVICAQKPMTNWNICIWVIFTTSRPVI